MTIANLRAASLVSTDVGASGSKKDSKSSASFSDVINLAGSKSADTNQGNVNKAQTDNNAKGQDKVDKTDKNSALKNTKDNNRSDNVNKKDDVNRNESSDKVSDSAKDGRNVKDVADATEDKDVTQGAMDQEIKDMIDPIAMSIEQIMTMMVNVLNISEEDLSSTMEELNMVPEDLLDGENILKVVMTSNELSSTMELFNNEELAGQVKDLMNLINQTKEQLNVAEVTPEEAKAIMAEEVVVTETTEEVDVEVEGETETEVVNEVKVTVSDERNASTDSDQPKEHEHEGRNQEVNDKHGNTVTQNVFTQLTQAVTQTTTSYTSAQAVDIVNQIVEEIRAVVKADTTSMELQLNPASLGKVHIQVASKEGVITAQITAQTEAAKNAIEGQIAVLRENFQNQGLKVEAVEVTVNPEGFNEFSEQQAFEENDGKEGEGKGKKQINLDDLNLEEEELTEEEAINIDMMQRAGNSVDFTA